MAIAGGGSDEGPRLYTTEGLAGTAYVAASPRFELIRTPDLGLDTGNATSRDAEYLYERRDPDRSRNLAGARTVEIDWLRAWLEAWVTQEAP